MKTHNIITAVLLAGAVVLEVAEKGDAAGLFVILAMINYVVGLLLEWDYIDNKGNEMRESEFDGKYGVVKGPDLDGDFVISDDDGYLYVDDKMLDFMIEHRQIKGKML